MKSGMTVLLIFLAMIFSISCSKPTENSSDKKEVPKSVSTAKPGGKGYKDYRWGMTVNEATKIGSKLSSTGKVDIDSMYRHEGVYNYALEEGLKKFNYSETGGLRNPLAVEKGKISCFETKDEALNFLFVDEKLRSITVSFKFGEDPLPSLFEKYGKREMKTKFIGNAQWEICSWEDGDRIINYSSMMPRGGMGYDVQYMDKDWVNVLYAKVVEETEKKLNRTKGKID